MARRVWSRVRAMSDKSNHLVEWFCQWRQPLRRYLLLRRAGSAADVEDMAQEVFLRLVRYDRADLITHPQAYLFKIAANVAAEWAVRQKRSLAHSADWLSELVDDADPEGMLERQETEATLLEQINNLPARAREMLRLHFAEGLKYEEVADRMGLTRRIVKRDLARAYAVVRMSLEALPTATLRSAESIGFP